MQPALVLLSAIVDPRGRADRFGFFLTFAIAALVAQGLLLIAADLGREGAVLQVLAVWMLAVPCQRRLHDLNLSGWLVWAVLPLLFMWSVVASLIIGAVALTAGGETLAMLGDGQPLHLALVAAVALPVVIVGLWLSVKPGDARDNPYGPVPGRFGLSGRHPRHAGAVAPAGRGLPA